MSIKGDESEDPFETVIQEYRVKKQGRIDDNKKMKMKLKKKTVKILKFLKKK